MEAANVILNDPFYLCIPSKNYIGQECRVILSQKSLVIQASSDVSSVKNREIPIENLVGCLCMKNDSSHQHSSRSNNQDNPNSVFLSIYFYSLAKSLTKNEYRKRETLLLRCCKYSSFEENCNIISRCVCMSYCIIMMNSKLLIMLIFFSADGKAQSSQSLEVRIKEIIKRQSSNFHHQQMQQH